MEQGEGWESWEGVEEKDSMGHRDIKAVCVRVGGEWRGKVMEEVSG